MLDAFTDREDVVVARAQVIADDDAAPDLEAGRLVMPFDFKMSSEAAYYLVYPAEAIRRRKIKAFRDWIVTLTEAVPARQTAA